MSRDEKSRVDTRDPNRARGVGVLHPKDEAGTYRARQTPGRNDPCACGSGRKAKRCHPDGLRPRVDRVEPAAAGPCSACGATDRPTVPLKHDRTPGAALARVCFPCLRQDPQKALQAILTRRTAPEAHSGAPVAPQAPSPGFPPDPPSVPLPPAPAAPAASRAEDTPVSEPLP